MNQALSPIVLLTDFGYTDPFVGIMKGVMAGIAPDARVIDLTHGILPQHIFQGAFVLYRSMDYFPRGTIFCAIVDPGVGTARRPIALKTRDFYFVGPDNGLLWPAAHANGIEACRSLDNPDFFLPSVSKTFHGRDIFAPVSARLWLGTPFEEFGGQVDTPVSLEFPVPEYKDDALVLTVMDKDRFGNLTLNLSLDTFQPFLGMAFSLDFKGTSIHSFHETYGQADDAHPFILAGSSGFIEVAVKNGNAARDLRADVMDQFLLKRLSHSIKAKLGGSEKSQ